MMFWVSFGLGSTLLVISVIGSQVPWKDFTFEKAVSFVAGLLLGSALVLGKPYRRAGRAGSTLTIVLSMELILCLYTLVSLLTYRGH
jgi:hypothetical protein